MLRILLLIARRIPMGHDTFQYLQLEYTFFNEAALHGGRPLWLPFMTQGSPSSFWIVVSQGLLASAVSPIATFLRHVDFLYLFEAGFLVDEFALLLGCMLLARRFYRSFAAVLFVSVSVTYSAVSSTQPWYDFHLIYLVPLILYCFDRAVAEASVWHLFLAGLLGIAVLLGNLPYFEPILVFTVFVFGCSTFAFAPKEIMASLERIRTRLSWRYLVAIFVPVSFAFGLGLFLTEGLAHSSMANIGRGAHGEVSSLVEFLTYGGYVGLGKYAELVGRYSNNLDNTLYAGLLIVPFVLVALLGVRSRVSYAVGLTGLILVSFGAATIVSLAFFYFVPLGRFFRHVGLTAPLAKMFIVFYAGFGVEAFWEVLRNSRKTPWSERSTSDKRILLTPVVAVVLILLLVVTRRVTGYPVLQFPPWVASTANQLYVEPRGVSSALDHLVILGGSFVVLLAALVRWPRLALALGSSMLVLHGLDVLWLKAELEFRRVPQVSEAVFDLFRTYDYAFPLQRTMDYRSNDRFAVLQSTVLQEGTLLGGGHEPHSTIGRYGALYWNLESFLFLDAPTSPFRTDFWQDSIDGFYHVWVPSSKTLPRHLGFPIPESPVYRKLSGLEFPKLQVFSRIHVLRDDDNIAGALRDRDSRGDAIFTSGSDIVGNQGIPQTVVTRGPRPALDADDRLLHASVSVQQFTFDTLRLQVSAPSAEGAVLYYADAWHPAWRAYVDGEPTAVLRTNLGYKSIIVPRGASEVELKFGTWFSRRLLDATVLLAILALGGVISLLVIDFPASFPSSPWNRAREEGLSPVARDSKKPSQRFGSLDRFKLGVQRAVVAYGATYFFWNGLAVRTLREGVWNAIHVVDAADLPLITAGISIVATVSCALLAYLTRRSRYPRFLLAIAILGVVVDLVALVQPAGILPMTRLWVLLHLAAIVIVGAVIETGIHSPGVAHVVAGVLFGYAWLGSTLQTCYVPGVAVNVNYDPNRSAYTVTAVGSRGREHYTLPTGCYGSQDLAPILALEGYRGFNIIHLFGQYYAIRQSEGRFEIGKVDSGAYSEVFAGDTLREVERKIGAGLANVPALVVQGYKGFNIIFYRDAYFAIPQGDGAFDGQRFRAGGYTRGIKGRSIGEVKRQVDSLR